MLKFRPSAFQHKATRFQMEDVLKNRWGMTKWFPIHEDRYGNSQDMAVGFDSDGLMLEIGLSYIDDDEIVFHAQKATLGWRKKYNQG